MSDVIRPYQYHVHELVRVIDGDSMEVVIDLGYDVWLTKGLRVAHVDTPEVRNYKKHGDAPHAEAGKAVKAAVEKWLANTQLFIDSHTILEARRNDKYGGRVLGAVARWIEGYTEQQEFLHEWLISREMGKPYEGDTKPEWSEEDLEHARLNALAFLADDNQA